jgi:hypothetical protein
VASTVFDFAHLRLFWVLAVGIEAITHSENSIGGFMNGLAIGFLLIRRSLETGNREGKPFLKAKSDRDWGQANGKKADSI